MYLQGYPVPQPGAPGYGQPVPGYGQSAPGYGAPAPGYAAFAPGYAAPAGYPQPWFPEQGALPPGYGQPQAAPGYGQLHPWYLAGYGQPAAGYGQPTADYGQAQQGQPQHQPQPPQQQQQPQRDRDRYRDRGQGRSQQQSGREHKLGAQWKPIEYDNLYVRGLPGTLNSHQMKQIFAQYCTVVSCKLLPPVKGNEDAAGFVRCKTDEEAKWVIDNLNGKVPNGLANPIVLRYAGQPPPAKGEKGGGASGCGFGCGFGGGGGCWNGGKAGDLQKADIQESDNLYIKGLPAGTDSDSLQLQLSLYGLSATDGKFTGRSTSLLSVAAQPSSAIAAPQPSNVSLGPGSEPPQRWRKLDPNSIPLDKRREADRIIKEIEASSRGDLDNGASLDAEDEEPKFSAVGGTGAHRSGAASKPKGDKGEDTAVAGAAKAQSQRTRPRFSAAQIKALADRLQEHKAERDLADRKQSEAQLAAKDGEHVPEKDSTAAVVAHQDQKNSMLYVAGVAAGAAQDQFSGTSPSVFRMTVTMASKNPDKPTATLYVEGLPLNMMLEQCIALFDQCGSVRRLRWMPALSGCSGACGAFVTMETPQEACQVVQKFHGQKVMMSASEAIDDSNRFKFVFIRTSP